MLQKLPIIMKNTSDKSCSQLNFPQKSQWGHIFISSWGGTRGGGVPKISVFKILEYSQLRKFTLRLNAAKNTACNKIYFKYKLFPTKFFTKKSVGAYASISSRSGTSGLFAFLKYYNVRKCENSL